MRFLDQVTAGEGAKPFEVAEPNTPPLAALRAIAELRGSLGWRLFLDVVNQQVAGLEATVFTSKDVHEVMAAREAAVRLSTISQWPERAFKQLEAQVRKPTRTDSRDEG